MDRIPKKDESSKSGKSNSSGGGGGSGGEGMKSQLGSSGSKKGVETNKYNLQYKRPGPASKPRKSLFEEMEMAKKNNKSNFSLMDVMSTMKKKDGDKKGEATDIRSRELAAKLKQDKIRQEKIEREMKAVMEIQVKDKADFRVFSAFTSWKESVGDDDKATVEIFKCWVCNININGGKVEVIGHLR